MRKAKILGPKKVQRDGVEFKLEAVKLSRLAGVQVQDVATCRAAGGYPEPMTFPSDASSLRAIKLAHTVVWAFFAGSIVAIPLLAAAARFRAAFVLVAVVMVEVVILAVNGMRCPLTGVAARYTDDRRDNFDIYLPEWLARHNKTVFGTLFVLGAALAVVLWARS